MKKLTITVLIPCYNEAEHINRSIESVLEAASKTNFRINIIVSDNNSSDNTRSILRKLESQNANLQLIFQDQNIGARENWMVLLRCAKSEYLMFLDAHDYISSDYFWEIEMEIERQNFSINVLNTSFLPNEFQEIEEMSNLVIPNSDNFHFSQNPKIRFWQLLNLNNATIVHSIIPRAALDINFLSNSVSYSFDQLLIHSFSQKTSLYQMSSSKYFRLYKKEYSDGHTYRNSSGELETRVQRVQGTSSREWTDETLGSEIVKQCRQVIPFFLRHIAMILITGKYIPRGLPYVCFRLFRYSFNTFGPYKT